MFKKERKKERMKEKSTVESNCKNICLIYTDNITELLLKCHGVNFNGLCGAPVECICLSRPQLCHKQYFT